MNHSTLLKLWGAMLIFAISFATTAAAAETRNALFIATSNVPAGKFKVLADIAAPHDIKVDVLYLDKIPAEAGADLFKGRDIVLVDSYLVDAVQAKIGKALAQSQLPIAWVWDKKPAGSGLPKAMIERLALYYSNGGRANFDAFFQTLAAQLNGTPASNIPEPILVPEAGVYHPRATHVFADPVAYLEWIRKPGDEKKPVIGIAFHEQYIASLQTASIDALIKRVEDAGAIPMAVFYPAMATDAMTRVLAHDGKSLADALITTRIMLGPDAPRAEMTALGIPVIQAMPYRRGDESEWRADPHGVNVMDVPFYMAQAEYAGIIDIQVASATGKQEQQLLPIKVQVDAMVEKAMNLVTLQRKPIHDKRVTVLFWNYPSGEKNFGASFMNVPESLGTTLTALAAAGYDTHAPESKTLLADLQRLLAPYYREGRLADLEKDGLAARLPLAEYRAWLETLPEHARTRLQAEIGDPANSPMLQGQGKDAHFIIPRLALGKVVLMPQPPRSGAIDDKEKAIYHSTNAAPDHFYLAAYLWARKHSDALVHFGTHGTQEWLPGKERGLAMDDYPMLAIGNTPIIYPYIADNIGEALQARRRGRAVIISHQTPPFRPAGLHDDLTAMHDLLHQWQNQIEGEVREQLKKDLMAKVASNHIDLDMGWDGARASKEFPAFIDALHTHLHDLAQTAQPLGLHTLGIAPETEHRLATVLLMLGKPYIEAAARHAGVAEDQLDETLATDYAKLTQSAPFALLKQVLVDGQTPAGISTELAEQLKQARSYYDSIGAANELPALIDALAGKYIPTSYGGDPIKHPDAYPTGRNLYPFDPSRVPTSQAWEAGKIAAEALLAAHQKDSGSIPDKITFSLWSVETMRHQGLLEAQALWLLGVEPVWDKGGRVEDVRLIDRKTLGRARVDVVLSITGLYRDQFPNAMKQLARAVELAAQAKETDNAVAQNASRIEADLISQGIDAKAAKNAAQTRIFSSASGRYGTGLDDATLASDTWGGKAEGDQKLAALYLEKMQYAYGPDMKLWGERGVAGKQDVNLYASQLKGTDGAVLSRTSNTYGMLTTDDPFQYLGGIGLAVRSLDGAPPKLYISNLRGGGAGRVDSAAGFLAKELSTREFHPGYIKALMDEGYSGTLSVLESTNNLWGWTSVAREVVRDDQWEEMVNVYVRDKYKLGIKDWFEQNNPHAQAQIIERMLEAARKGYWQTNAATIKELKTRYQELAQRFDVVSDNQAFLAYAANGDVAEFNAKGEAIPPPERDHSAMPENIKTEQVEGMKLEKAEAAQNTPVDPRLPWIPIAIVLIVIAGAARQATLKRAA
ncbi:MAG TPA: cobaltochelatase subunit CobN [Chiayiivirga sp.]|nr:cobaltochelatase subunit CobN [Chiayiivirga sp.]